VPDLHGSDAAGKKAAMPALLPPSLLNAPHQLQLQLLPHLPQKLHPGRREPTCASKRLPCQLLRQTHEVPALNLCAHGAQTCLGQLDTLRRSHQAHSGDISTSNGRVSCPPFADGPREHKQSHPAAGRLGVAVS